MLRTLSDAICIKLFHILWRQSLVGVAIVEPSGKFYAANPEFCELLEFTESELLRKHFKEITLPAHQDADQEMVDAVLRGAVPGYRMRKTYITKLGSFLPVLLHVWPVRDEQENITFFMAQITPTGAPYRSTEMEQQTISVQQKLRFLYYIRTYWVQILFFFGLLGYAAKILVNGE